MKSVKNQYLYRGQNFPEMSLRGSQDGCARSDSRFSLISPIPLIDLADAVKALSHIRILRMPHKVSEHSHARPAIIPAGSWPLEMRAETAAAYCDEPSVDAFLAKVQRGVYCAPTRQKNACRNGIAGNSIVTLRAGMDYISTISPSPRMQRI